LSIIKRSSGAALDIVPPPLGFCLIKSINDLVDVVKHRYVHLAMNGVVQSHSKIFVDSSSSDCHLSRSILKDAFIFLPEPINHVIISSAAAVTQFAVMHIKAYCHLCAIDSLVHYARIVWVDFESNTCQTLGEFMIVQLACNHCTI
jgi:hypothetical protein